MQVLMFRGTPDEFQEVAHLFIEAKAADPAPPKSAATSPPAGETGQLTPELVELALTRIPLSPSQALVLRLIHDAGAAGVLASDINKQLKGIGADYAGVSGGLGRRFSFTPGWPKGSWPCSTKPEGNDYRFVADPAFIEAVKRGRIKFS